MARAFGSLNAEPTCQLNAIAKATRRDYVLATNSGLKLISSFKIDRTSGLPVHAILQVRFCYRPSDVAYNAIALPKSLHNAFITKCQDVYRNDNPEMAHNKNELEKGKSKKLICTVDISSAASQGFPKQTNSEHKGLAQSIIDICDAAGAS